MDNVRSTFGLILCCLDNFTTLVVQVESFSLPKLFQPCVHEGFFGIRRCLMENGLAGKLSSCKILEFVIEVFSNDVIVT